MVTNEKIFLGWDNIEHTKNLVEKKFENLDDYSTIVKISESWWKNEDQKSLDVIRVTLMVGCKCNAGLK